MSLPQRQNDLELAMDTPSYRQPLVKEYRKSRKVAFLFIKRMMDILGAFIGLMIVSPILVVVFIFLKIEDPRAPVIYKQIRVGKYGRKFAMYKVRSMVVNAEHRQKELLHLNEIQGAMFKIKEDPRVTKVGKVIRRTSIDELPQLINVLKGDMSLVGPRPPLPKEVEQYTEYDKQRLQVIPGCTGLWQVSGRNRLSFREMVELDLKYIRERTIMFDVYILFRTVRVLFGSNDAY